MNTPGDAPLLDALREVVHPLAASDRHDRLVAAIGDARVVLLGESTHGTHEFYAERARLTQRLVAEQGFHAVAVEAGWPDAAGVNRWVRGLGGARDAEAALRGFRRFPAWLWRNTDVLAFVRWLRAHDDALPPGAPRVGFYGLDLYGQRHAADAVLAFLAATDEAAAHAAAERYRCLEPPAPAGEAPRSGAAAAGREDPLAEQLAELLRLARGVDPADEAAAEAWFDAVESARVVMDADAWRSALATGRVAGWNVRARHMADALDALLAHLDRRVGRARVVVWEHNAHLGDARATDLARRGAVSMGQLVRARHGEDAFLVGFTTWSGTVTAASRWGGPPERKPIEPAPAGSCEALFHAVGIPRFAIDLRAPGAAAAALERPRPQRAIGVLHAPPAERPYAAALRAQFDAAVHVDVTTPVEPLEADAAPDGAEPPETYPSGV